MEKTADMNNYYFCVNPGDDCSVWEFTIEDLIDAEFESYPDIFPDKAVKIKFLKEPIADIEECIKKVENDR